MKIEELQQLYAMSPRVKALADVLGKKSDETVFLSGLVASSLAMTFAALPSTPWGKQKGSPLLFIMQDADAAGYLYHDLQQLLGEGKVLFFPSSYRRSVKYGQRDAANEILRTEVLAALSSKPDGLYIVSYPEAVAELVVSKKRLDSRTLSLRLGQSVATDSITETLRDFGFREVDYVYEPGQFAQRGSILDVFSYSSEYPFRIDFFGDDIDSIRTFEVENQLSRDKREQVEIVPELSGEAEDRVSLLSFLPKDTLLVMKDRTYVREVIDKTYNEGFSEQAIKERLADATEQEQAQIISAMRKEVQLTTGAQFQREAQAFRNILLSAATNHQPPTDNRQSTLSFSVSPQPLFHKNFELLKQTLGDYRLRGYHIYILADSQKQNERLKEILAPSITPSRTKVSAAAPSTPGATEEGAAPFTPVEKTLHEGFIDNDLKLCVLTDHQIFDRFHKYNLKSDKARSGKMALTLKEIQQFEVGDYIVHIDHGIGKFGGLVRMPIAQSNQSNQNNLSNQNNQNNQSYQEMIKIIYHGGGAIYVSIHSLYKVSKYKSQEGGEAPRLSQLGTGQWERIKQRTKQKLKDIARDLIKLYAARRRERGYAFSPDSSLQHELEASFLYEDTPDQLKATNDVKADMEKARPMDRLVCGDVGFGKTEVAVRAAFKAACDSKQTAVLVPTTVLAYQHYQTFSSRLKNMPVRVEYLSRARSTKKTKEILQDLADGKIDILIGTHKLIGKTVKFKDLGLLIIDEEQKFGVSTKEKLRQMKTNVDTLTMSATPIPRTLQFSLVGARDLSTIQTPPPNRYPIQTEIHTFSPDIIADAINFEMSRNGQVYFVNNRISDLTRLAEMIHKYVPDARIAVGHGQMKPDELEQIIFDFANYDYDVLLSTTIVENGIDIPNANTIIINGAQNFGLSDLHQMRGRVGRGNRKAFCYLLAPPLSVLSVEARRRLEALENFSELGSGINIAMQDLDIRGAGNLLGSEQSGFIADLGYETYLKILNEAVVELHNEDPLSFTEGDTIVRRQGNEAPSGAVGGASFVTDCTLESDLEMYFPDQYVPSDSERMLLYRELDNLNSDDELERYRKRLLDRFGKLPHQAEELLLVVPLRRIGKQLGIEKIMLKQGRMTLFFVSSPHSPYYQSDVFDNILNFVATNPRRCNFREQNGRRSLALTDVPTVEAAVKLLASIRK
ncbi:MAG: transcription-repair coupling factor [Prevotella sp.]|nr:transcription-repair coupling factor [Prevotella sp.]